MYDNLCALESSLNYEQPKGSEDTEDSSTTNEKEIQTNSSDDYTESFTYASEVIIPPSRRRENSDEKGRRESRKSALIQRSKADPHYNEVKRSKG